MATTLSNKNTNLDLTAAKDRMGNWTYFAYNSIQLKTAETNALGRVTFYNYCDCGALDSIQDALANYTYFYYDNLGRRTATVYPGGSSMTNRYNLIGQLTNVVDSAGVSVTNWFNNQGLQSAVSNAFGQVMKISFDLEDHATNSVDANGVSIDTTYDVLGRPLTRTYPDGGVEKFGYSTNGLIAYTNQLNQVTRYVYDAAGRKTYETNANLELSQFTYNAAGDLLTLTDGKSQTTSWNHNQYGLATNKVDAASNVLFVYSYDANNRLTNRYSIAKGNTVYRYDAVGSLTNIDYNVSPDITLQYDALNRLTNMMDAVGTTPYGYTSFGALQSEDGPWASDTVSYTYDNGRRRSGLALLAPNASAWTQSYGYDTANRMTNITSPAGAFSYGYDATRKLQVNKLSLPNASYVTNTYDNVARLLSTILKNSTSGVLNSHAYAYNAGNQRTALTNTAGDYRNFTYDNIGQLKTALGKESGGTSRLNEQFGYTYDTAGNLNFRTNNALIQIFGVNNLNELTNATRTGTLTVAGTTTSQATNVTVNSSNAILYADATFAVSNFSLLDGNNTFTAIAQDTYNRKDTNAVTVNLPATNNYTYDLNGNMLTNGTEILVYDDENQLVTNYLASAWKSEFVYDGKNRRRIERDYTWSGAWVLTNETRFIYDGNAVIQHRDANNLLLLTLTRGRDLSGSMQGAGGIGGLLAMTENAAVSPGHSYYHADGNGNVTCLISTNQLVVAKALFDPFGNFLSLSGPKASVNCYWFSSKPIHWASGKYDFLYRWYAPQLQRWLNRDPIGERGGLNLYNYVRNNPVNETDPLGLDRNHNAPPSSDYLFPKPTTTSNFPGVIDASIVGGFGGGASVIYCCNDQKRRIKARFVKWCVGPYIGASATGGFQQGASGSGCPDKYKGWFIEGGGGVGVFAFGGFVSPDGSVGGASAGIGLYGGVMWCKYTLATVEDVGCCK